MFVVSKYLIPERVTPRRELGVDKTFDMIFALEADDICDNFGVARCADDHDTVHQVLAPNVHSERRAPLLRASLSTVGLDSPSLKSALLERSHVLRRKRKPFPTLTFLSKTAVPVLFDSFWVVCLDDVHRIRFLG